MVVSYGDWRATPTTATALLDPWRAQALNATLGGRRTALENGASLPPLWHWLYFLETANQDALGVDGHPPRGGFLPPVELPRRMFAGSELRVDVPLTLGSECVRRSQVTSVDAKTGRSGDLVFVGVQHELTDSSGGSIVEKQTLVYRDAGAPGGQAPVASTESAWQRAYTPTPTLLFRYSALTFNAHRIHYDLPYATGEEGYANLVVHGPLLATQMAELAGEFAPDRALRSFRFQAASPTFVDEPYTARADVAGDEVSVWVEAGGTLRVRGSMTLS